MSTATAIALDARDSEQDLTAEWLEKFKHGAIAFARLNYLQVYYSLCAELAKQGLKPSDFAYIHEVERRGRKLNVIAGSRIGEGWELFTSGGWDWSDYLKGGFFKVDTQEGEVGNLTYKGIYTPLIPGDKRRQQCGCRDAYGLAYYRCGSICKHQLCKLWLYISLCHLFDWLGFSTLNQARLNRDIEKEAAEADLLLWG